MNKIADFISQRIILILKKDPYGLTITDMVNKTNSSRSAVRIALAKLEGGNIVSIKRIGMAKVYSLMKK